MDDEKKIRRCLHFLGMISSQAGDAVNAAEMLQRTMTEAGITFGDLLTYALHRTSAFQYALSHFEELKSKAHRIWTQKAAEERARARLEKEKAKARKFDQRIDPGPEWTWVRSHTRRSASGTTCTVRGHWRHSPRRKEAEAVRLKKAA